MFDFGSLTSGLYWLHCTGPDGPVVLLGGYDSRTGIVHLVDEYCTPYVHEGAWLHKWRVYHAEPIHRPEPLPVGDPA